MCTLKSKVDCNLHSIIVKLGYQFVDLGTGDGVEAGEQ